MKASRLIAAVGVPLVGAACYRYVPTTVEHVRVGVEVRVRLSPEGAERVAGSVGSDDSLVPSDRMLVAEVLRNDGEAVLMAVLASRAVANPGKVLKQRLAIPREDILAIEVRELDRKKTTRLIAAATVALGVLVVEAISGETGGSQTPPRGEQPEAVLPRHPARAP